MPIVSYGRATATNPGKHGRLDWRVEFNGQAPTHAELVWMATYFMLAEDRYVAGDKRERLWWFLQQAHGMGDNHQANNQLAQRVQRAVDDPSSFTLPRKRRTKGGDGWLCEDCRRQVALLDGLCGACWLTVWKQENEAEMSAGQGADSPQDVRRTGRGQTADMSAENARKKLRTSTGCPHVDGSEGSDGKTFLPSNVP